MKCVQNINDQVALTLTPYGLEKWLASEEGKIHLPFQGHVRAQLWLVMAILGPHMFCGSRQLIEDNTITIGEVRL